MPFDGQNAALITLPDTLEAALIESAIETVEPHILDAHKAEEIRLNPAGWFYRRRVVVQITSIALLTVGTVAASALFVLVHVELGIGLLLLTLAFAIAQSTIRVRGSALWRERAIEDLNALHPVVREAAERLQERLPQVDFRLGELIQNRTILDPYLVAEYGDERAVLGMTQPRPEAEARIPPRAD
jgi:hypothetical protein